MSAAVRGRCRRRSDGGTAVGALVVLAVIGLAVRHRPVTSPEAQVFRTVNELPGWLRPPLVTVMQLGSLGGVVAVTVIALGLRRPAIGRDVAVAGLLAWASAKAVKRLVERPRPADSLAGVIVRGHRESGFGYPSSHTAVATAVVVAALILRRRRPTVGVPMAVSVSVAVALALLVGIARLFVGAHLPLDVAGGLALGTAAAGVARFVIGDRTRSLGPCADLTAAAPPSRPRP